jgi:hypothetical protein
MIKVVVLAVIELKQVLKIVEDLADYIALGVTGVVEKRQWSGYLQNRVTDFRHESTVKIASVAGLCLFPNIFFN